MHTAKALRLRLLDAITDAIRDGLPLHEALTVQAEVLLHTTSTLGDLLAQHGYEALPTRELVDRVLDAASEVPPLAVVPDPE